jgi:hypothetical protein
MIQDIEGFDSAEFDRFYRNSNMPSWFTNSRKEYYLSKNQQFQSILTPSISWEFELFRFNKKADGVIEMHLNYSGNKDIIGLPNRDNHKIADLVSGKTITYRINGKIDGHSQRVFIEYKYVINHLGTYDRIEFKTPSQIEITKPLDLANAKTIDERKIMK